MISTEDMVGIPRPLSIPFCCPHSAPDLLILLSPVNAFVVGAKGEDCGVLDIMEPSVTRESFVAKVRVWARAKTIGRLPTLEE
jgi:hypothetical protein